MLWSVSALKMDRPFVAPVIVTWTPASTAGISSAILPAMPPVTSVPAGFAQFRLNLL